MSKVRYYEIEKLIAKEWSMTRPLPPGQTVNVNGMQMYYVQHGEGEPLVLLHGFTGSSNDWTPFFEISPKNTGW